MKNTEQNIKKINSIKELHSFMGLPSPLNPLITIIDHSSTTNYNTILKMKNCFLIFTIFQSKEVLKEN